METRMLLGAAAVLAGFACGYTLAMRVAGAMRRRGVALAAQGEPHSVAGLLSWRLRNGYRWLLPAARLVLRSPRVRPFARSAVEALSQRGLACTEESLLSCLVAGVALVAVGAAVATGSAAGAVACAVCAVCIVAVAMGNVTDKRAEEVREAIPGAIESMSACFGSGFTLLQTFQQVARDTPGPLGQTFQKGAHVLEMGGTASAALRGLREGAQAPELAFVAVALDVQHQSGGAMRQVLDAAAESVKGELALRRSLRVQTAQAKLSARVVVVMPFILVAAFSLASPDFLSPFFASPAGWGLFSLAVLMEVAGIVLVRRALSVEGVT